MAKLHDSDFDLALQLQFSDDQFHKSTDDSDFALALQLQSNDDKPALKGAESNHSIVDSSLEYIDPTPDIYALFREFDRVYFWGKLDCCSLQWSTQMTLCAGVCKYEGRGGLCSIHLSQPLLKLRPRKDLVETLLHEMIHAYLFVTNNNKDHNAHGPEFVKHMKRINELTGTNITIYHSFHDEVDLYRQHWWQCDGPCRNTKPYFGLLKRAKNRPPGPSDFWWKDHQTICGGNYIKIKSPEQTMGTKRKATSAVPQSQVADTAFTPFQGEGHVLGTTKQNQLKSNKVVVPRTSAKQESSKSGVSPEPKRSKPMRQSNLENYIQNISPKKLINVQEIDLTSSEACGPSTQCPVCQSFVEEANINQHLDICLSSS